MVGQPHEYGARVNAAYVHKCSSIRKCTHLQCARKVYFKNSWHKWLLSADYTVNFLSQYLLSHAAPVRGTTCFLPIMVQII